MSFNAIARVLKVCTETRLHLKLARQPGADLQALKTAWATSIIALAGLEVEITGTVSRDRATLFLGNHVSYLDIPLLMACVPGVSFVAKEEVSRWPVFGAGARFLETIFVKRECADQRRAARSAIAAALRAGGRVALFPSGTTCATESIDWRRGAFEVARESGAAVQPFRLTYDPIRTAAFIEKDLLPFHMLKLMRSRPLKVKLEFHAPVRVADPEVSRLKWRDWAREIHARSAGM